MFDPTGTKLLSAEGFSEKGLKLWDLATSTPIATFPYGGEQAVIHPDGQTVYTGLSNIIKAWGLDEKVSED